MTRTTPIGFQKIIGGTPKSVKGMSNHLLNNTLTKEMADIAAYYGRGGPELLIVELAREIAAGEMVLSEAMDTLVHDWIKNGGDVDQIEATEERLLDRLSDLTLRMEEGHDDMHLAVLRPDIHPSVLLGLGIEADGILTRDEINALIAGRKANGELIDGKKYAVERALPSDPKDGVRRWSTPIGSYDFCPTPDKSVSVAWAFATQAEQATIYHAHLEAAREAVAYIAAEIGVAGIGKAGREGSEAGHVGWLEFTHHTSRRVSVRPGQEGSEVVPDNDSAGDPHLHTHFLIPNAVFCDSGRVGSLDTAAIRGFLFEAGAFYHATMAQKLRDNGFEVVLDHKTGAARMTAIPDHIREMFSSRTRIGEKLAREWTLKQGEVWDDLEPEQQAARITNATRNPEQRGKGEKDPVADFDAWKRHAREAGWIAPWSLRLYGPPERQLQGEELHRAAYDVALPFWQRSSNMRRLSRIGIYAWHLFVA